MATQQSQHIRHFVYAMNCESADYAVKGVRIFGSVSEEYIPDAFHLLQF